MSRGTAMLADAPHLSSQTASYHRNSPCVNWSGPLDAVAQLLSSEHGSSCHIGGVRVGSREYFAARLRKLFKASLLVSDGLPAAWCNGPTNRGSDFIQVTNIPQGQLSTYFMWWQLSPSRESGPPPTGHIQHHYCMYYQIRSLQVCD